MSKDTTKVAPEGQPPAKPKVSKPATAKAKAKGTRSRKASTKAAATAPAKGAVKKAARNAAESVAKRAPKRAADKTATDKNTAASKPAKADGVSTPVKTAPPSKPRKAKPRLSAKPAGREQVTAPAVPSLGLSLQAAVPAAVAMNTKLVDIAQANVSAGLELARGLAGAKTPMEAMQLGVAYWFNHIGAVQAQARELQSLSAAWVKTASAQTRAG